MNAFSKPRHVVLSLLMCCAGAGGAPPVTDGLKVWLDAGSLGGLADGAAVSMWGDLAAGFIPGDGAQDAVLGQGAGDPSFVASDPDAGGNPAVGFDGDDALGFAGSLGLDPAEGGQAFTVFIVATNAKSGISNGFSFGDIANGNADGSTESSVKCDISTSQAGLRFNGGNRLFADGFEASRYRVGLFRMDEGDTFGEAIHRRDNEEAVEASTANPDNTINLLDEGYHVGMGLAGNTGLPTEFMNGRIVEILFYTRALSDTEANQVGFHLEQKYGLDTDFVDGPGPDPRPNVLLVLVDDMGWSDLGCYGGEARTPHIDSLAAAGVRFRNFHNTARCSPTRGSLLTGNYSHQVAVDPGASLPNLRTDNNVTIPELLGSAGYRTYMAGKWHLGSAVGRRTTDRGFQHVFGMGSHVSGAGADYWTEGAYDLVSQGNEISKRSYSGSTFYQSDAIGDYAIDFLRHHMEKGDGGRFFLYLPFNPPHFDVQAPADVADTYMDVYDDGWEVVRQQRYARQLALGVIDAGYPLSPPSDTPYNSTPTIQAIPAWDTLGADRKADLVRRMALYAAMIDKVDQNVGRVIDRLRHTGQLDNTLVFFLSDNGGNAEGGRFGRAFGQNNHAPLTGSDLTNMGQAGTGDDIWLGGGWANVNNTPFRYYKRFSHEGGIRTPLIVHWPGRLANPGRWSNQFGHVMDVMRTVVEATGATFPASFGGHPVTPMEGESLMPVIDNGAEFPRQVGFEHESTRSFVDGEWKLVTKTFSSTDDSSPANALELYHMGNDPTELTNLILTEPSRVRDMIIVWNEWAGRVGVPAERLLGVPLPAPASMAGDLFVDNFNRSSATDVDNSATGSSGSRVPPMGVGAIYYEGFEGSGSVDSIQVLDSKLQLAVGNGMSENGLMHNFIGQDIIDAGGFSVELSVTAINSATTQIDDRYVGFGVGLSQAEAAGGSDISGADSFRGSVANPIGKSDFFVDFDLNGDVKVWRKGVLLETVAVGETVGTITAKFALDGFLTTSTAEVTVFFNGRALDIDSSDPQSISRTFSWDADDTNYIGLSARATVYTEMDNLAVRLLPLADALAMGYSVATGLDGADSAPGADPDHDGRPNFLEWAIGSDPGKADIEVAPLTLLSVDSGTARFEFETRRLQDRAAIPLSYRVMVSPDLVSWTEVDPAIIGIPVPVPGNPGYETVEMALPEGEVTAAGPVFVLIAVQAE